MCFFKLKNKGFGLIEILITLGVLAIGVLGVAALHSTVTKQSQENKARSEAFAIAQSRIEEMRNYTDSASTPDQFHALYADTTGYENSTSIAGVSTVFTRTERILTSGEQKNIAVAVNWTSSDSQTRNINLSTELGFVSPRAVGDTVRERSEPLVSAPTGRARLGEGVLPEGAVTISNNDGTALYQDGGNDLMLVSGEQIVLTLTNACQADAGTCLDFVKIRGRVYIDKVSQPQLTPGQVYLVASDAAFCARYYTAGDAINTVTAATASTISTAAGDYEYFDYTCYIGGGWHGNVGVLLAGGLRQSDKICVGDPVSANPWEAPIIATRRSYRGMLYKHNAGNASGREEMSDGDGGTLIRYYSYGVADSTELPVPNTDEQGHNFVLGSMPTAATEGSNCITQGVMVRADATIDGAPGGLFEGIPRDFYCLNPAFLDSYDEAVFGNDSHCPFDPTNPPSTRHIVSGLISVLAAQSSANTALVSNVNALTSDGVGNCLVGIFAYDGSKYNANYACDVFDWGNGWNGFVRVTYDASGMSCSPNQLSFSGINADISTNNFSNCSPGSFVVISGTVTTPNPNNRYLTSATLSDGGACTLENGGLAYSCVTSGITGTWNGTISFGLSGGILCNSNSRVITFSNVAPGFLTRNLVMTNNASQCP